VENDQRRFFDDRMAQQYDATVRRADTSDTVAFLADLAKGGPALELGIGTGRIALPLAERGMVVDGVDISPEMVDRLQEKPGGDGLAVTIGDLADVPVSGTYRLVFVVYNSICNLGSQDEQVRCFQNVAEHLTEDGVFVVEGYVPLAEWLQRGQYVEAEAVAADSVRLDVCRVDAVHQVLNENHVVLSAAGVSVYPTVTRYIWPSELDLMARLAGLRLIERWATWTCAPFTGESSHYISVYGR
jgi:SAM-dependent methyltransferase